MSRLILMSALFLIGCGPREWIIPDALTEEVVVECRPGDTSRALGECALQLREGLNLANSKLKQIRTLNQGGTPR